MVEHKKILGSLSDSNVRDKSEIPYSFIMLYLMEILRFLETWIFQSNSGRHPRLLRLSD